MSPIFDPDFQSVDMNIPTYEGRAQIQVTKMIPFRTTKDDGKGNVTEIGGVKYNLEMIGIYDDEGELETDKLKGKQVSRYTVWLHTTGGWQYGKPFLTAACGYRRNQEAEANEKVFPANKWTVEGELDAAPDTFETGNGWDIPVGQVVEVSLSVKLSENKADPDNPYKNQEFAGWAPVAA